MDTFAVECRACFAAWVWAGEMRRLHISSRAPTWALIESINWPFSSRGAGFVSQGTVNTGGSHDHSGQRSSTIAREHFCRSPATSFSSLSPFHSLNIQFHMFKKVMCNSVMDLCKIILGSIRFAVANWKRIITGICFGEMAEMTEKITYIKRTELFYRFRYRFVHILYKIH